MTFVFQSANSLFYDFCFPECKFFVLLTFVYQGASFRSSSFVFQRASSLLFGFCYPELFVYEMKGSPFDVLDPCVIVVDLDKVHDMR